MNDLLDFSKFYIGFLFIGFLIVKSYLDGYKDGVEKRNEIKKEEDY